MYFKAPLINIITWEIFFFSIINCCIRALILMVWTWLVNLCNVRLVRPNIYGRLNNEAKAIVAVNWPNILRATEEFFCTKDGVSKQVQTWTAVLRNVHLGTTAENKKVKRTTNRFSKPWRNSKIFQNCSIKRGAIVCLAKLAQLYQNSDSVLLIISNQKTL